ncbi:DUF2478 domain-containing protein [Thalassovita taeanensis]|uniref:ABC-type molybdate transport system, ATPase component n=1 Tax=Thalassovita taeanensis TaxID=657014 RepID=A0A1H9H8F8_9RHOB|nr:DUF2478 domain-containing protein [Thalassovita taeanensis]SEQ58553.1 Protein of unknown function [Thalassovita taeanensis]
MKTSLYQSQIVTGPYAATVSDTATYGQFRDLTAKWVTFLSEKRELMLVGFPMPKTHDIDQGLWSLARALRDAGVRIEGHIQLRGATQGDCNCREMNLVDLSDDSRSRISENRGPRARGCHLDWAALTAAAAALQARIAQGTDIVVVNRFGRAEAEGAGMRGVISDALSSGARVVVGYRPDYAEAWAAFHGGMAQDLPM